MDLIYDEEDYLNLTNYKVFCQHIRPLVVAENPKVPMPKIVMLLGAKWREFSATLPPKSSKLDDSESTKDTSLTEVAAEVDPEPGACYCCEIQCLVPHA